MGLNPFLFKYSGEPLASTIVDTLSLEARFSEKLPALFRAAGLITRRSLEQCSSEALAEYKASLFSGQKALVLAAGLGIDDIALSSAFSELYSIELNTELNDISTFNFNKLNISNINRLSTSAEDFLKENDSFFDLIYCDPDRRSEDKRQILLSEHSPNIIQLLPEIRKCSSKLLIKCSPLYDYEMALRELESVVRIIAVSKDGEVKEMLIECDFENPEQPLRLECVDISTKEKKHVSCSFIEKEERSELKGFQETDNILYEAGSSLVKMRLEGRYAAQLELKVIDPKVPYFTSDEYHESFIGRVFVIIEHMEFSASLAAGYFQSKGITQANIKTRGLKFDTAEIRKKLKLKDGGEDYIFILPSIGKKLMFHCRKLLRHSQS